MDFGVGVPEVVFKITDGRDKVSSRWFSVPLCSGGTSKVRDLQKIIKEDFTALADVGFSLTSLSGSLLLPDTRLGKVPALAVKVSSAAFDSVMKAYQEFEEVQETDPPLDMSNMLAAQRMIEAATGNHTPQHQAFFSPVVSENPTPVARNLDIGREWTPSDDEIRLNRHPHRVPQQLENTNNGVPVGRTPHKVQDEHDLHRFPNLEHLLAPASAPPEFPPPDLEMQKNHALLQQMIPAANLAAYLMSQAATQAAQVGRSPSPPDTVHRAMFQFPESTAKQEVQPQATMKEGRQDEHRRSHSESKSSPEPSEAGEQARSPGSRRHNWIKWSNSRNSEDAGDDAGHHRNKWSNSRNSEDAGDDADHNRIKWSNSRNSEDAGNDAGHHRGLQSPYERERTRAPITPSKRDHRGLDKRDSEGSRKKKCVAPLRPVDAPPGQHCLTPNDSLELLSSTGERTAIGSHFLRISKSGEGEGGGGDGCWEMYLAKRTALVDFLLNPKAYIGSRLHGCLPKADGFSYKTPPIKSAPYHTFGVRTQWRMSHKEDDVEEGNVKAGGERRTSRWDGTLCDDRHTRNEHSTGTYADRNTTANASASALNKRGHVGEWNAEERRRDEHCTGNLIGREEADAHAHVSANSNAMNKKCNAREWDGEDRRREHSTGTLSEREEADVNANAMTKKRNAREWDGEERRRDHSTGTLSEREEADADADANAMTKRRNVREWDGDERRREHSTGSFSDRKEAHCHTNANANTANKWRGADERDREAPWPENGAGVKAERGDSAGVKAPWHENGAGVKAELGDGARVKLECGRVAPSDRGGDIAVVPAPAVSNAARWRDATSDRRGDLDVIPSPAAVKAESWRDATSNRGGDIAVVPGPAVGSSHVGRNKSSDHRTDPASAPTSVPDREAYIPAAFGICGYMDTSINLGGSSCPASKCPSDREHRIPVLYRAISELSALVVTEVLHRAINLEVDWASISCFYVRLQRLSFYAELQTAIYQHWQCLELDLSLRRASSCTGNA
eukprot:gene26201-11931_t